jgi:hypothetical protein
MNFTIAIILCLLSQIAFSQGIATTFEKAEQQGISLTELDSKYQSALHDDSTKAVFHSRKDEFYKAYVALLNDLNKHLKKNGYVWHQPVRCFNRIYLSAEGRIEYFMYNFQNGVLEKDKEAKFNRLLKSFISDYQFAVTAKTKFAQCSPVIYKSE